MILIATVDEVEPSHAKGRGRDQFIFVSAGPSKVWGCGGGRTAEDAKASGGSTQAALLAIHTPFVSSLYRSRKGERAQTAELHGGKCHALAKAWEACECIQMTIMLAMSPRCILDTHTWTELRGKQLFGFPGKANLDDPCQKAN